RHLDRRRAGHPRPGDRGTRRRRRTRGGAARGAGRNLPAHSRSRCRAHVRRGAGPAHLGFPRADQRDSPDTPARTLGRAMTTTAQSPAVADPTRLTTRLRIILAIVLLADVLDLMD